jgi:hypothetical protein
VDRISNDLCACGHEHQGVLSYWLRDRTNPEVPVGFTQSHTDLSFNILVTCLYRPIGPSGSHADPQTYASIYLLCDRTDP